ncbi:GTP pyrophosphokinase [Acetobacter orientalis]|uniref:GTP pyrophosphokinase n=1 Tax=Acetobacter orientalis TaxID=146474 RepID=A0A2Z5ZJY2_9PROT|nr:GTP pyrophosphokinase [Acetobacter orientalis]
MFKAFYQKYHRATETHPPPLMGHATLGIYAPFATLLTKN